MMFLGLLKKAFEQTKFDKKSFFYSEWELAFITLWSVLNEIQEAVFKKTQPSLALHDSNGDPYTYLNRHFQWKYKDDIFIEYNYQLDKNISGNFSSMKDKYQLIGTQMSNLNYDAITRNYSLLPGDGRVRAKYEDKLFAQILFILLKMKANNTLIHDLLQLNKVRNKLYLTHGDDSENSNFSTLYKAQRKSDPFWKSRIELLFNIVYFLCTGKEGNWNN